MAFSPFSRFLLATAALAMLVALTLGMYWIGLRGPFMFDDNLALGVVQTWHRGTTTLQQVMLGNTSWATHRALSMGSLALNAWALGFTPHAFKLGNLVIHLLVGAAGFLALSAMLRRDEILESRARWIAAFIVTVWLLHPLNVSTVLYVVQRMAQVATLFCLLGVWLYIVLRNRIELGDRRAWIGLYLAIPLFTALGIQGKQNAAVLPALCLVVELAYFRWPRTWPKPLSAFFALTILLPLVLATLLLVAKPDLLLNGYGEYEFTPVQRLLSEARVLCSYLRMLLAPYPPSMGVYTDDYIASTGLLSPPSTLLAVALLLAASWGAFKARRSMPSVFAGWFFYLVAHAVEGTLLPLELYYEHRNYLPAYGIFLACAGLIAAAGPQLAMRGIRVARIGVVAGVCLLAVLAVQTHGRSRVWSDKYVLVESALRSHPDSPRAAITYMGTAMETGNIPLGRRAANEILRSSTSPRLRGLVMLFDIRLDCAELRKASPDDLAAALRTLPSHVDLTTALTFGYVRAGFQGGACEGISDRQLADAMVAAADRSNQPESAWPKLYLRHSAAKLYGSEGDWTNALAQARQVWQPSTEPSAATILVEALLAQGCRMEAEQVYRDALKRVRPNVSEDHGGIAAIKRILDGARNAAPPGGQPNCSS